MPPAAKKVTRSRRRRPALERKIHFFRANGLGTTSSGKPRTLNLGQLLPALGRLSFDGSTEYQDVGDGNFVGVWIDEANPVGRFRIATIRRQALPLVEDNGQLTPLNLRQTAGLYEAAHVCVFSNNIVGMEFNFYGPRVGRIPAFLVPATGHRRFTLDPLLRQNVADQLNRLDDLRVLSLRIRPSYTSVIREADADLASAFEAAERFGNAQTVQVVLSPEPYGRQNLGRRALEAVKQLAGRSDLQENVEEFQVKGPETETGGVLPIDLLSDELVVAKRILRVDGRTRALRDVEAYAAIEEAYTELKDELDQAASVSAATR
ncbi:MAG TPA: hypothetical protein VHB69_02985 [Mycobacteriales bacterium]|nr:hypothetical protein [Mycobacteriales bacterium]